MRPLSRNVGNQLLTYTAQYPTRAKASKFFLPHNKYIPIKRRHISIKFTDTQDVWQYSRATYNLTAVVLCTYPALSTWATLLFQTRFYRHDLQVSSGPLSNSHSGVNTNNTILSIYLIEKKTHTHIKRFHSFVTQPTKHQPKPKPNQPSKHKISSKKLAFVQK
jgi:hypothetical protein